MFGKKIKNEDKVKNASYVKLFKKLAESVKKNPKDGEKRIKLAGDTLGKKYRSILEDIEKMYPIGELFI